jgi:hypothetical protein
LNDGPLGPVLVMSLSGLEQSGKALLAHLNPPGGWIITYMLSSEIWIALSYSRPPSPLRGEGSRVRIRRAGRPRGQRCV